MLMTNFGKLVSHSDFSGMGFGTTFIPAQKSALEYAQISLRKRGIDCELKYTYQNDMAEATFTLKDSDGTPRAGMKFSERWQNLGDEKRPLIHTVYNYDLYLSTSLSGWLHIAFSQAQETRRVPHNIQQQIISNLNELAKANNLFPRVRSIVFGARSPENN